MLFKDHLEIVTDAGAVLHLGWDYDAPYFLDPLNGIDVDLKTAQGVNQVGDTVEGQSVSGVSRTLDVVFWGAYALDNARVFSKKNSILHQGHPVLWRPLFHPVRAAENALLFQLHAAAALFAHALQRKALLV